MSSYVVVSDGSGRAVCGNAYRTPVEAEIAYNRECLLVDKEWQSHGKLWRWRHSPKRVYLWDTNVSNLYPIARHCAKVDE